MFELRKATNADIPRIMEIMEQAKQQMYREGKHQWDESYPAQVHIATDTTNDVGYVLCHDGTIIAYAAIVFTGEPAYDKIEGGWLSEQPYIVVHRLAVADEMKHQGIATLFMQETEKLALANNIHSFKIDTNYDNLYMQNMLTHLGFKYCGEINYEKGVRMGYEKII